MTNQARRAQIVQATMELIAEQGYRAATFQAVAARAGLASTRTIAARGSGTGMSIDRTSSGFS